MSIKYKNKIISEDDIVTFIRKNKTYEKKIYYFMTDIMKVNLSDKINIKQWFVDYTHYAIPRKNNSFKLFLIIGFNIKENKSVLGSIILIKNENEETFSSIFKYLNSQYSFYPEIINCDCYIAEIKAIKKTFNDSHIIICYYHVIKRIIQHLPEIRNKNKIKKEHAKNLLNNIKILIFIKKSNIMEYYKLMENKYKTEFPAFFKYFKKNHFQKYPLKELDWNYDINDDLNPIDIKQYFFSNNICESTNPTLNMNYKGSCKTLFLLNQLF